MTDKIAEKSPVKDEQPSAFEAEMEELKREMRSAQWAEWVQKNQKSMMIAVAFLLVALMAGGIWIENRKAQAESAANLYQQAVMAADATQKQAMMEAVIKDFGAGSYGALALMQLANLDRASREAHLNALIAHPAAMAEWVWEAKLDLAALKIQQGDKAAAMQQLEGQFGN